MRIPSGPSPARRPRRGAGLAALALSGLVLVSARCSDFDGFIQEPYLAERQDTWLAYATDSVRAGSATNVLAHLERSARDPAFAFAAGSVPADAWNGTFDKVYALRDTSDFNMLDFVNLLYAGRGHPAVPPELWERTKQAVLDFKYSFTDPTPARTVNGQPVVDNMWYWTENHVLIFRTCELLAGQLYPNETFTVTGLTGAQHKARARPAILAWIDHHSRWGFFEWHSNVYYHLDIQPLLTLVEWSDDAEIVQRATMALDLVFLDIALHLHRGTFGATHGRSYPKDYPSAELEDMYQLNKLLFDDTTLDWSPPGRHFEGTGAAYMARAKRYRLPEVIRRIAKNDAPLVDRERMSLPLPEQPPAAWNDPLPTPPYGLTYTEADLDVWWSMGAQPVWAIIPTTLVVAERENLWVSQLSDFALFRDLVWVDGDLDATLDAAHLLDVNFWRALNQATLSEVNTYTYRTKDYMLSTAQDYRKGLRGSQTRSWQATLGERAIVLTQHPGKLAVSSGPPPATYDWQKDEPGPGYWTGDASQPRSAQFENVGISLYAPQYRKDILLNFFPYRDETHAYFPHAHFDEVVQEGPWTFGRKDDAYVALYSLNPTSWRTTQPELYLNAGLPFDLVAPGPQNVWIVECGSLDQSRSFTAFRAAIVASTVVTTPAPDRGGDGLPDGYDVVYESPSQGTVTFGWDAPLTVRGAPVPLADYPRMDNPFVTAEFDRARYDVSDGEYTLDLDFATQQRRASGRPGELAKALESVEAAWNAFVPGFGQNPASP
jgi:hypothetical protein